MVLFSFNGVSCLKTFQKYFFQKSISCFFFLHIFPSLYPLFYTVYEIQKTNTRLIGGTFLIPTVVFVKKILLLTLSKIFSGCRFRILRFYENFLKFASVFQIEIQKKEKRRKTDHLIPFVF